MLVGTAGTFHQTKRKRGKNENGNKFPKDLTIGLLDEGDGSFHTSRSLENTDSFSGHLRNILRHWKRSLNKVKVAYYIKAVVTVKRQNLIRQKEFL
jgi:hypothetical protein